MEFRKYSKNMAGFLTFVILLFLVSSVVLSRNILPKNFPIFHSFFDSLAIVHNIIFILISLLMSWVFSFFYRRKERINWWLILTIFIILFIYVFGMLFINDYVGEKDMEFDLKNNSNISETLVTQDKINCTGARGSIIANEMVTCGVQDFNLSEGVINFILAKGANDPVNLTDGIEFFVPENLIKADFTLNGTLKNKTTMLSGSLTETYPTYEEFRENKNVFIQYAAILIVFLLVSVPTFMTKLKELIEGNKQKEGDKTGQTTDD